jgi:hypothetical protein
MRFPTLPNTTQLAVLALMAYGTLAHASLVQSTPQLPPPNGIYTLPLICLPGFCVSGASIDNFHTVSDIFGANETVTSTANFAAQVFTNVGGSPGSLLGSLSVGGNVDFTYFGRTSPTQLGTFNAQITDFDFTGAFAGHAFAIMQNPAFPSTGVTTISEIADRKFLVTSFFDVFAELSIDGGPFVPGPPRHTVVQAVPEPASGVLAILGIFAFALRRRGTAARALENRG